jgi:hypothetical protein
MNMKKEAQVFAADEKRSLCMQNLTRALTAAKLLLENYEGSDSPVLLSPLQGVGLPVNSQGDPSNCT